MAPQLVVLGWDSATFDIVDPLIQQGRLPVLAGMIERGSRAPLRSTWPPMTDCAWTSAFTGRNPGAHGIFGSWYRAPGAYECRYFSSRDRMAPAAWEVGRERRWLLWNVPMTFPPAAVNGVMVAGYGAPPGARFCAPDAFQDDLERRWEPAALLDRAPHGSLEGFRQELLDGLVHQAEALPWAAREAGADCVAAVWPHVDRAQHFFWRFRGTNHPLASAVDEVYEAMDRATGRIVEAFPDADVLVVSDHGAGPLRGDVNVGAWLAGNGRAAYGKKKTSLAVRAAWAMPPTIRRLGRRLAPGAAQRTMGATLSGQLGSFDWERTDAFLGVHSDLWLNLEGRERMGRVATSDAPEVLEELRAGLLGLRDPRDGAPLFAAAHRRADVYSGPAVDLAPDLILDSWSAGYRVAPGREASDRLVVPPAQLAGVGEAWSSDHRPLGIFVAAGPRIARGASDELALYDVCPTSLALLEQPVPPDLDGRVADRVIRREWLESHPIRRGDGGGTRSVEGGYSQEEADAVAAHLKDLGYIE